MTKIVCGSIDCVYNTDKHTCSVKALKLTAQSIHTLYEGRREFWTCNQYEVSDDYKKQCERIEQYLKDKL